ncbi:hypothetical protein IEQ34_007035 [Dendrobium chrysotoxum]|uniref:Uncharacterized protein n=1 Tax=Dendrobium chrysotoxum TaxID=161865 RepID=A0AAV7GS11_DENCH|nr:hypothetical protein IEQ34_007035 [Dendrobium chrysotoxum]
MQPSTYFTSSFIPQPLSHSTRAYNCFKSRPALSSCAIQATFHSNLRNEEFRRESCGCDYGWRPYKGRPLSLNVSKSLLPLAE